MFCIVDTNYHLYEKIKEVNFMNINRLKDIRLDRDFKQIDIANALGIKQQQYSEYERGIVLISIEKINTLADFYNTSVDYLMGRTDERKPYPKSILK